MGKVRILPECVLPDCLEGARPPSHRKFCCSPLEQDMVVKTAVDRCGKTLTSVNMVINQQVRVQTNSLNCVILITLYHRDVRISELHIRPV